MPDWARPAGWTWEDDRSMPRAIRVPFRWGEVAPDQPVGDGTLPSTPPQGLRRGACFEAVSTGWFGRLARRHSNAILTSVMIRRAETAESTELARLRLAAVDRNDPALLHQQVALELRRAVAQGEARPGERIPQAKDLAAVLGVNTNTVLRALRVLRDEGCWRWGGAVPSGLPACPSGPRSSRRSASSSSSACATGTGATTWWRCSKTSLARRRGR